jgi:hypothetical protein
MNAKAITIAILCFTAPIGVNAQESCDYLVESPENCNRFVGCINDGEDTFSGTSRGWETGFLHGEKKSGATCTGTWVFDGFIEKGEGKFSCSDDDNVEINFFTRGETIQAITGVTISEKGNRIRLWSSPDLTAYFKQEFPDSTIAGYQCGDTWIPLPTVFPDVEAATPTE